MGASSTHSRFSASLRITSMMLCSLGLTWVAGCHWVNRGPINLDQIEPSQEVLQRIEYPDLADDSAEYAEEILTGPPMTISNFQEMQPLDMTIDECVRMALSESKVMQKLGGVVVNSPGGATTLYDQAIRESSGQGVEAALSQFDTQFSSRLFFDRTERTFNNAFVGGGANNLVTNASTFNAEITKQTAYGTQFSVRNLTDYNRNNSAFNRFGSVYNMVNQVEMRQPLGRGAGTLVNRIAGVNAAPGQYNGVVIARIRTDISLADFEASVRDLIRDVENNYWELYFAYRDLNTKITARDAVRETWETRKLRFNEGIDRPDDEAQARQTYLTFKGQAQIALTGVPGGTLGVLGSERNMRRLLGMPVNDGRVIRPVSDPTTAPIVFDWAESQQETLQQRVEVRRQKWTIRQRELELVAAKALNRWRFDLVGLYGKRGFGDNLFGSRDRPNGSAFDDMVNGNLDDWQLGFDVNGAIGNRAGHLAIRNAELNLTREKTLLKEQQRQLLHDLSRAFVEIDRAMATLMVSFDSRVAVEQELKPKKERADLGRDPIFFLLDAQQRAATSESAVHRSIADYNKALMTYSYTTGSLLSRYGIVLTEGPWTEDAQINAMEKAARFSPRNGNREITPVSGGVYDQGFFTTEVIDTPVDAEAMDEMEFAPDLDLGDIPQN